MGMKISTVRTSTGLVEKYIGTAYDNVKTVADDIDNVNAVVDNIGSVNIVAPSIDSVNTVAASQDKVDTVADNILDVNTVVSNMVDINIAAENVLDINTFANVWQGSSVTDPTIRTTGDALQTGDLYFNTESESIKVWNGLAWSTQAPFAGVREVIELASGQTDVTFTSNLAGANIFVFGTDVDNSRLLQGVDYVPDFSNNTLVLTQTYPAGSLLVSEQADVSTTLDASILPYTPDNNLSGSVGQALDNRQKVFDNVTAMQADASLYIGQKVRTLGYYSVGDGGGNDYEIVAVGTGTVDGGSFIDLTESGLQASSLNKDSVDIAVFGLNNQNPLSRALSSGASVITNKHRKNITQSESVTLARVLVDLNNASLSFDSFVGPAVLLNGDDTTIKRCRIYGPGVGDVGIGVYIGGETVLKNIHLHQVEVSDFPLNGIFVDGVTNSSFSELSFFNNQFSASSDFTGNFRIDNSSEVIVDNVHLENFYGKGVAFAFSEKCVLKGLTAKNAQGTNSMAFYITGGSNRISVSSFTMDTSLNEGFKISRGSYNNSITSGIAVGGARGFQIQGSSRNTVSGLYVKNTGGGYAMRINSHDATNTGANDNVISGCVFEKELGNTPCILIDPSILVSERNLITSCVIKSNGIGIRIEGLAKDFLISTSRIETTGNCVFSTGQPERLVIDSCILSRESGAEAVTLSGLDASVNNCKITHKSGSLCVAVTSTGFGAKVLRNELITSGTNAVNVHPSASGFVAAFNVTHANINDASTGGVVSNNVSI